MSAKILLVTALDETHRKPLLESEGYTVKTVRAEAVHEEMNARNYNLMLLEKDCAVDVIAFCNEIRGRHPDLRIGIIAQRAEYVPASPSIDAVIRQQHSPRTFLNAVKRLLVSAGFADKYRSASEGQ